MGPELEKVMRELGLRMQLLRASQDDGKASGLCERDALILGLLAERGKMTVSEIMAAEPTVSESTISVYVTKLWRRKLVTKTISPDNQRVTIVELTKKGREAIEVYDSQKSERFRMFFEAINVTDEEQDVLVRVFGRATGFFDKFLSFTKEKSQAIK